jgi:Fur family ferric uptake transcriptional regulator
MDPIHQQEKQQIKRLFEKEGIDQIGERMSVLEIFLGTEKHMSLKDFMDRLGEEGLDFDPDFVKKTLKLMCRYGFASKKRFEGQPTLYEHRHLGLHHDHLICMKCQRIIEFRNHRLEQLQVEVAATHGFHMLQHKMEIYGLCSECLKDRVSLMPLSSAQEGERGIIEEFMGGSGAQMRLATMGLRTGDEVEVITNRGEGQIVVAVNTTRLALGRGISAKIMVKPNGSRRSLP